MDNYAVAATTATTTIPPSSSQIHQDPYIYSQQPQQYDPSQHQQSYTYYDYSQTYPNPDPNAALYQPQQYDPTQHQYDPSKQQPQEQAPIHPPGVPVQTDPSYDPNYAAYYAATQTHYQADASYYYQQPQQQPQPQQVGYSDPNMGQQQWQQAPPTATNPGQPAEYGLTSVYPAQNTVAGQYAGSGGGGGRGGGRGGRNGGRGGVRGGGSSFRGGGRGGGRGGIPRIKPEPKPQFLAFCELCRVDCNTQEVLENHLSGKKHKKNVEIQEQLKKLAAKTHEAQLAAAAAFEKQEVKPESQPFKPESQQQQRLPKRKTRDGEKRSSSDPEKKQKETVPFICEMCDVKCESAPSFDSHLKGRKHVFNLQRFQEQQAQAALGQVALQALYPALIQALAQNGSTSYGYGANADQTALLQLLQPYLPQTGSGFVPAGPGFQPGPQGSNPGQNQVGPGHETEPKTEADVAQESKTDGDQVGPGNETEVEPEKVETETKTDQVGDLVAAEPAQ